MEMLCIVATCAVLTIGTIILAVDTVQFIARCWRHLIGKKPEGGR